MDAFTARLVPGSTDDPGAREACVTNYIDRKLAEHASFATTTYFHPPFAKPAKDRAARLQRRHGVRRRGRDLTATGSSRASPRNSRTASASGSWTRLPLATASVRSISCPPGQQDAIIGDLEADKVKSFEKPTGGGFFGMLQDDTNEGMFADPIYGGNRDFAGWKLIGYPGRAAGLHALQELKNGPHERTIQGLRDMPRDAPRPCRRRT